MSRHAERLIKARSTVPEHMRSANFDAWLLPLILDALEPVQRDLMDWLLIGENNHVPVSTNDLCVALETLPTRIGLTLSRLRRIGLVQTTYQTDEHGRSAYHVAVAWVRQARAMQVQMAREQWSDFFSQAV